MTPNLPLPQRAATLAAQVFREAGHELPLNVVQEAIARSRGHKSFQECLAAAVPAKGVHPNEGLELWCITGREFGDDDDTTALLWAPSQDKATDCFIEETLQLTLDEAGAGPEGNPRYFIVDTNCIGAVRNGVFELSAWFRP